ncbi:MAG: sugar kinase [Gemmatimonadetes bacterium]|nr:sugar kinase [Gemmatimonadota bacterium]
MVVGSVALDSVKTQHGAVERAVGGSAVFFAAASCKLSPVATIGVVGEDYPMEKLQGLKNQGVDLTGIEQAKGKSFFWAGEYSENFTSRKTLITDLGVFEHFNPSIGGHLAKSRCLFLGNIHPAVQSNVLEQMDSPELVVCDTMNYWIDQNKKELLDLLRRVDILMINDSEARQLTGESNLLQASKVIQGFGPRSVVIKKGEHGALFFATDWCFSVPGLLLEKVVDPTGAGDSFAGGFMGYLSAQNAFTPDVFRTAMVYGTVMGSFAVESFSIDMLEMINEENILKRVSELKKLTAFD